DVLGGAFLGDFDHASADFQITIGIFGIDHCEGNAGITANILVFLAASRGIEDHVVTIKVAPDGSDLGPSIGLEGRETGEGSFLKKIFVLVGYSLRHESSGHFLLRNRSSNRL